MRYNYEYKSGNVPGNLHDLAMFLNTWKEAVGWELVAAQHSGYNTVYILKRAVPV